MDTESLLEIQHPQETEVVLQALSGDSVAANKMLNYLSSSIADLRRLMVEAIYDADDPRIWEKLLHCLALHQWDGKTDCQRRREPGASARIDRQITDLFVSDQSDRDKAGKEAALLDGLRNHHPAIRRTAALLMGLRGDRRAVPELRATLEVGSKDQQLAAIKALEALGDQSCGPPLLLALASDEGQVHREAGRALIRLGRLVEDTWLKALDHPDQHIRWHAARGLGNIGEARFADMLAEGLLDENREVRWATADVLAHLGAAGVPATLRILSQSQINAQTLQAAFHALHGVRSRAVQARLQPLLAAMKGPAASVEAPAVAQRLLLDWQG